MGWDVRSLWAIPGKGFIAQAIGDKGQDDLDARYAGGDVAVGSEIGPSRFAFMKSRERGRH